MDNQDPQPNIPNQQGNLGQDPNFLRYLQGFLAKPKNADMIRGKRISSVTLADGQTLVYKQATNLWTPMQVTASAVSGTITLLKLTTLGANGSITVVNGIITAFTNPT